MGRSREPRQEGAGSFGCRGEGAPRERGAAVRARAASDRARPGGRALPVPAPRPDHGSAAAALLVVATEGAGPAARRRPISQPWPTNSSGSSPKASRRRRRRSSGSRVPRARSASGRGVASSMTRTCSRRKRVVVGRTSTGCSSVCIEHIVPFAKCPSYSLHARALSVRVSESPRNADSRCRSAGQVQLRRLDVSWRGARRARVARARR
jgi:hypothetical protein